MGTHIKFSSTSLPTTLSYIPRSEQLKRVATIAGDERLVILIMASSFGALSIRALVGLGEIDLHSTASPSDRRAPSVESHSYYSIHNGMLSAMESCTGCYSIGVDPV